MAATLRTFRKADGTTYRKGDTWRQPDLAGTLEAIAAGGADAFYRGPLARTLATRVAAMGGIWTEADLAAYKAVEREPIRFSYHGHDVITMPPPSGGGVTMRQILAASDALHMERLEWDSVERIHLYVEALRRIYADSTQLARRSRVRRNPADDVARQRLHPQAHGRHRSRQGDAVVGDPLGRRAAAEHLETTHFSVVDGAGMAVASTFTLNGGFGAKVQVPGTGVTLNNEMDDFTAKPGAPNMFGLVMGAQNAIQPGKRMLSSMTPTIVAKDGKLRAVVGSPGGPTIITTVAQIVLQLIDHQRPLVDAVARHAHPPPVDARRDRLRGGAAGADDRRAQGQGPRDASPGAHRRRQLHRGRPEDRRADRGRRRGARRRQGVGVLSATEMPDTPPVLRVVLAAWLAACAACTRSPRTEAGFWFEPVTFRSAVLNGAVTPADLNVVESAARAELVHAFEGLPITISERRDATFRVRVVQEVRDRRLRGNWGVAGESFSVPGLGGQSSVSFFFLASGAVAHAPPDVPRAEVLTAIGRGIGRTAAHELAHLLLPQAPIHDSTDIRSYEYDSAARREQYFGEMHWALARPLLLERLAR